MYQSYASADKDVGAISKLVRKGPTFLYVEVENLDETIAAVKGAEVVIPGAPRSTAPERSASRTPPDTS